MPERYCIRFKGTVYVTVVSMLFIFSFGLAANGFLIQANRNKFTAHIPILCNVLILQARHNRMERCFIITIFEY